MPAPTTPPSDKKEINWARLSKQASFWLLIILVPTMIFKLGGFKGETAKINFNPAFRAYVEANAIDSVLVQDEHWTGTFRQPQLIKGKPYTRFSTQVQKER